MELELYRAFFICRIRGFLGSDGSEDPDSALEAIVAMRLVGMSRGRQKASAVCFARS